MDTLNMGWTVIAVALIAGNAASAWVAGCKVNRAVVEGNAMLARLFTALWFGNSVAVALLVNKIWRIWT